MSWADVLLDGALALSLPFLAWRVLKAHALAQAVPLFIAFGMLSALAWARLSAPDIALVEAAVGAGLTGALLTYTLGWGELGPREWTRARIAGVMLGVAFTVTILGRALFAVPATTPEVVSRIWDAVPQSGANHPVTAVLLNFRGYDTFLEVAVLLVAALAVRSMPGVQEPLGGSPAGRLLPLQLVQLTLPLVLLAAGHLLLVGADAPGGAFQAAAVLAGGGLMAVLGGVAPAPRWLSRPVKWALLVGPGVFAAMGAYTLWTRGTLLKLPVERAGMMLFTLEAVLMISIACVLLLFFPALRQSGPGEAR